MLISEFILRKLSKKISAEDNTQDELSKDMNNNLFLLRKEYHDFSNFVRGKRVLDYGCGVGKQSIALSKEENCFVCGIDTNENTLSRAKENANKAGIDSDKVVFYSKLPEKLAGTFDVVISQNAMEHFPDPMAVLRDMKKFVNSTGKILITFGPPWFAPYGSHMQFFCTIPWINILFSEKTVMNVRSFYRSDGATKYEEVESGLNMMTLRKFDRIVDDSNLIVVSKKYSVVKGQDWIAKIPLIRELFVNHVTTVLTLQDK